LTVSDVVAQLRHVDAPAVRLTLPLVGTTVAPSDNCKQEWFTFITCNGDAIDQNEIAVKTVYIE